MIRPTKTAQIQLRVTPAEKRALTREARQAGVHLSVWIMGRLLPARAAAFKRLLAALATSPDSSYVFGELGELLRELTPGTFATVVESPPPVQLEEWVANHVAAMIETAAVRVGVRPPAWVDEIPPLRMPRFASTLTSARLHLLCNAPAAFRRRNLFVDSSFEHRV